MARTLNRAALLLLVVGLAVTPACRTPGTAPAGQTPVVQARPLEPPQALAALATEYWDARLRAHPLEDGDDFRLGSLMLRVALPQAAGEPASGLLVGGRDEQTYTS